MIDTVVTGLTNLTIEMAGTEEDTAEGHMTALLMYIEEKGEVDGEGDE